MTVFAGSARLNRDVFSLMWFHWCSSVSGTELCYILDSKHGYACRLSTPGQGHVQSAVGPDSLQKGLTIY